MNGPIPDGQAKPTPASVAEVCKDAKGSMWRLESEYPPNGFLVMNIGVAMLQGSFPSTPPPPNLHLYF